MVAEKSALSPNQLKRKLVHSLVDRRLQFTANNEVLGAWLGIDQLAGRQLVAVLPEVVGFESEILGLSTADVFTLTNIYRQTIRGGAVYFDVQIEPVGDLFALTLVDVTERVHLYAGTKRPSLAPHEELLSVPNSLVIEELEQHIRNFHLLNKASRTLITTMEREAVLEQLLQVATEIIEVKGCSIWLWEDESRQRMICQAVYHPAEEPALLGQILQVGQGVGGTAVATNQIIIAQNAQQDNRFYAGIDELTGVATTSIMAVPLHFHDVSLGVLEMVNKVDGRFTAEDQTIADTLATFATVAIYNAQLVSNLQESNEELDSFAHTVAHDLQNTLSIVIGFAELLRRDDARLAEDKRKQMAEALAKNTYKMSNIIKELLLLSSVRKADVAIAPLNMKQIVEAALLRLAYVLEDYSPELIVQEVWPVALGHAAWIEEIWENYISNALKYGGQPPRVECGGDVLADGRIRFWVRDNGPGLNEEEQAKLFGTFVQLNKIRIKGSGLGLSIVQRIAHKLGGEVGVESKIGQGSQFSFTLPAAISPTT